MHFPDARCASLRALGGRNFQQRKSGREFPTTTIAEFVVSIYQLRLALRHCRPLISSVTGASQKCRFLMTGPKKSPGAGCRKLVCQQCDDLDSIVVPALKVGGQPKG